ncbi:hypothetical protein U1Q18_030125 [Sarracenia purpurea var. burkii]
MALLSLPLHFAVASPKTYPQIKPTPILSHPFIKHSSITRSKRRKTRREFTKFTVRAAAAPEENEEESRQPNNDNGATESESASQSTVSAQKSSPNEVQSTKSTIGEPSELGSEIKKAMKERSESTDAAVGDFWSGVAEEIKEIEWPALPKVLATTGVVLGVIAGSSVVLLTVNAVLAELSDRIFAGKGVQDFFS